MSDNNTKKHIDSIYEYAGYFTAEIDSIYFYYKEKDTNYYDTYDNRTGTVMPCKDRIHTNITYYEYDPGEFYQKLADALVYRENRIICKTIPTPNTTTTGINECQHPQWATYNGFTETYDYCTKCDKMRKRS